AHAVTQVGADIEGYRWETGVFQAAELGLKEGMAQYYTAKTCERLQRLAPDAKATYEALLEKQPDAYQTHVPWLKDHKEEEARLAPASIATRSLSPKPSTRDSTPCRLI